MTPHNRPLATGGDSWPLPQDRPLCRIDDFVLRVARSSCSVSYATEVRGSAGVLLATKLAKQVNSPILYVTADIEQALAAAADARFFFDYLKLDLSQREAARVMLPSEDGPYSELHPDRKGLMAQTAALARLAQSEPPHLFIVPAMALARRVLPKEVVHQSTCHLHLNQVIDRESITTAWSQAGYLRVPIVEDKGTFAVRGGIVDVWSPDVDTPVRLELEGETVVRIRSFNPGDQRTNEEQYGFQVVPARASITSIETEARVRSAVRALCDSIDWPSSRARQLADDVASGRSFFGSEGFLPAYFDLVPLMDYFSRDACVVFEDAPSCLRALSLEIDRLQKAELARQNQPHFGLDAWMLDASAWVELLSKCRVVSLLHSAQSGKTSDFALAHLECTPEETPSLASTALASLLKANTAAKIPRGQTGNFESLVEYMHTWQSAEFDIVLAARSVTQADRMATLLSHRDFALDRRIESKAAKAGALPTIKLRVGRLARGVVLPLERQVLITEEEIFSHRAHGSKSRDRPTRSALEDLRSLVPGDYIVHEEHGIGRYMGLECRPINQVPIELLVIEYEGGKLFLPVYRLNQIQKHSTGEGQPKIDRLGGLSFAKTKAKVQRRLRQLADELLHLYSERLAVIRTPLSQTDDDYATFEATFPFEETRDQATAIVDVLSDLESDKVMDRLVCGDVGFGKTEVALRAAYRVAVSGRQVAVLCPTTVLAQQHFLTFRDRLSDFGLEVRVLSRFVKSSEAMKTLEDIKRGTVDVVVGTHRLLSKDVFFKQLGLLVVDEEQHFGVLHKERIKQLRKAVDVLTLSATPIPRTLQMALGGLREMSVIESPPVDRRPIRTIIARFDPDLVAEALRRELSRGGQVFYVYNRVVGLEDRALRLKLLVPEARVAVAHGQMSPELLERTMLRFVSGEYDVLVSTAIVESGLDIPRANTMFIDRADLLGLSQMYQLRGRIGRSPERAYCYLLVPNMSELEPEARTRLETIEQFTELGMGLRVAALDMEQRGAGDLLGAKQSGFVASVGFELFCRMLQDAASEARGKAVIHEVEPDLAVDVEALIPEDYVIDVGLRLAFYKQLAAATSAASVDETALEMEDRFGPPPNAARRLIALMRLKTVLRRLKVLGCDARSNSVKFNLRADTPIQLECVEQLLVHAPGAYRVTPDSRLVRQARPTECFADGIAHAEFMIAELEACSGIGTNW